jgi:hypothetical protein
VRRSLGVVAAVAVTGLAFFVPTTAAFAKGTITGTTVNATVGRYLNVPVGNGPSFDVASCSSANGAQVDCGLLTGKHLLSTVRIWCLEATTTGVAVTVNYLPNGANPPGPPTTLTVNCAAANVKSISVGNTHTGVPLNGITSVASCSVNTVGTDCEFSNKTITTRCTLTVADYTLPVLVTATVTVNGPSAINGKTVLVYFVCH